MKKPIDKTGTSGSLNEDVYIASIAITTPPYTVDQPRAEAFLIKHYAKKLSPERLAIMHRMFSHPGIARRHLAVDDLEQLVNEHPDDRIARFTNRAVDLSSEAINDALAQVDLPVDAISGLVVNTCTGYICPGISTYLIEKLGISHQIQAYDLVGSGCGGAIPNLQMCRNMANKTAAGVIMSVSVEICSATFQMDDDLSLIVSNAIFADGASAALIWQRPVGLGLTLIDSVSRFDPKYRDDIRYIYKNGKLYNQISVLIPKIAGKLVAKVISDLFKPRGLRIEDIRYWVFHPGGTKVINAIRDEVGLSEKHFQATRKILANFGNMSSPTVWFVLKEILNEGTTPGDWCVMVSFGAGMSAHAFLLKT